MWISYQAKTGVAATGAELAVLAAPLVFVAGVGYYGVVKPMAAGAVPKFIDVLSKNSVEQNRMWQLARQLSPPEAALARQISDKQIKEARLTGKLWYGDSYVLPQSYRRERIEAAEQMVRDAR